MFKYFGIKLCCMGKNQTVREKIMIALANNVHHADSISVYSDTSIAYCRSMLNKMADNKEITKICGRAQHSYYLNGDEQ